MLERSRQTNRNVIEEVQRLCYQIRKIKEITGEITVPLAV